MTPYPLDRPWVKADHDPRCCCHQCMPHVRHSFHYRRQVPSGRTIYPCGRLLIGDPNSEVQIQIDGVVHGTCYYSELVNCPGCIEACAAFGWRVGRDANVCTSEAA